MTKRWAILLLLFSAVAVAQTSKPAASKAVASKSPCRDTKTHLCIPEERFKDAIKLLDELDKENAATKKTLKSAVEGAKEIMDRLTVEGVRLAAENDRLVERYNALVDQYNALVARHNAVLASSSQPLYIAPPVSRWQRALQGAAAGASTFQPAPAPQPPVNCFGHVFNRDQFSWQCQ